MKIGTKVILTDIAKEDTYYDMPWKNDILIITHRHKDNEGLGYLYSFDSFSSDHEISFSMYSYELTKF